MQIVIKTRSDFHNWKWLDFVKLDSHQLKRMLKNDMLSPNDEHLLWRTHVAMAIESSLRKIGKYEFRLVLDTLKANYNASLSDCYENPDILKKTLKDTFGNSYETIVSSIEENLNGLALVDPVRNFLTTMKK